MGAKPNKRNGRVAKTRRQEAANDRAEPTRKMLKELFGKKEN